ncbi:MAG: TlpA family protein disulfide reductase [Planctomycetota bacterium]|nr:MAG: TlpA family protein disulfide reductase [Planctomycetota bacterium]
MMASAKVSTSLFSQTRLVFLGICICLALGLPGPLPAAAQESGAKAELVKLEAEFSEAFQAFVKQVQAAKTEAELAALPAYPNEYLRKPFAPKYAEAAARYAGSDEAIPFLLWLVESGSVLGPEHALPAAETLIQNHGQHPSLETLPSMLYGMDAAKIARPEYAAPRNKLRAAGKALFEKTPHRSVRAEASLLLLDLEDGGEKWTRKQRIGRLQQIIRLYPGTSAAEKAKQRIERLQILEVGSRALPLAGTLVDGSEFDLAKQNRIVVIEFWSKNCGPCRKSLKETGARVKKYDSKRVLHLGVHSDSVPLKTVAEFVEQQQIQWPVLADVGPGTGFGPIGRMWRLKKWPTTYIVDASGRIRFADVHGETIDSALDQLLNEPAK